MTALSLKPADQSHTAALLAIALASEGWSCEPAELLGDARAIVHAAARRDLRRLRSSAISTVFIFGEPRAA